LRQGKGAGRRLLHSLWEQPFFGFNAIASGKRADNIARARQLLCEPARWSAATLGVGVGTVQRISRELVPCDEPAANVGPQQIARTRNQDRPRPVP